MSNGGSCWPLLAKPEAGALSGELEIPSALEGCLQNVCHGSRSRKVYQINRFILHIFRALVAGESYLGFTCNKIEPFLQITYRKTVLIGTG